MSEEITFKAYLHFGNQPEGQVFIVKCQSGCDDESIYHDDVESYMAWECGGFPVGSDKELSIHEGLKAFDGLESFDMSNDFERILKEARDYAAKPSVENGIKIFSETVWFVKSPNYKKMSFETEQAAREFAASIAEEEKVNKILAEVKNKFSAATIRAILKAAEKVGK